MNEEIGQIDGVGFDELETELLTALVRLAGQGSVPAATQANQILERRREAEAAGRHSATLTGAEADPGALCYYLGELEQPVAVVEDHLDRRMTAGEKDRYEQGRTDRQMAIRAAELDKVRRGRAAPQKWMRAKGPK